MIEAGDAVFAVWVYGSQARGDWDELSDLDILVVGQEPESIPYETWNRDGSPPSVSHYNWGEIEIMAAYGSLFLHHVNLEGRPLSECGGGHSRLERLLRTLPPYQLYRRDIRAFQKTVLDVATSSTAGSTPEFELSVLGTVVRHAAVLACYLLGSPCFGRTAAVERAAIGLGLNREYLQEFAQLYQFRLSEDGRCQAPFKPSWKDVEEWSKSAFELVEYLGRAAHAYERGLSETH